jgi:hypothetical protein
MPPPEAPTNGSSVQTPCIGLVLSGGAARALALQQGGPCWSVHTGGQRVPGLPTRARGLSWG